MERQARSPKRPVGWAKPYWSRAGLYVCVTLLSFLVSLLVVRFGCGVLLRAAIPAEPIVWRVAEMALDVCISVGVTWYFAVREGYAQRTAKVRVSVGGGLLFLLVQCPVAILFAGAPYVAGPLASTLAQLIYFGNESIFASSIEASPPLLVVGCMVAADVFVLVPAMAIGEHVGVKAYKKEQAAIKGESHQP